MLRRSSPRSASFARNGSTSTIYFSAPTRQLEQPLELIRRRLYVAKAERIDTTQLEMKFASALAALDKLVATSGLTDGPSSAGSGDATSAGAMEKRVASTPTGRRDLRHEDVPEERIVLGDPRVDGTTAQIGTVRRQGGAHRHDAARDGSTSTIYFSAPSKRLSSSSR